MLPAEPELHHRTESGRSFPLQVWRFGEPVRAIASGPLGGGLGDRNWVINASVHRGYDRLDPDHHLTELAASLDLRGPGVGLLTAVDVGDASFAQDHGVRVMATVGLGYPTWAAAPADPELDTHPVGTINIIAQIPAALADAALVNLVATATEAKVQALCEHGVSATGTASDAIVIACVRTSRATDPFGGPRSTWGSRLARAAHAAVGAGIVRWSSRSGR